MKYVVRIALISAAVLANTAGAHADLGKIVGSYGKWDVRRSTDTMTDKITCVATYNGNNGIQLNKNALYIRVRGTPKGFEYRIDDQPKSAMILPSDVMQQIGAIEIDGAGFDNLVKARRLRVQVLTYSDLVDFDLNLSGVYDAYSAVYHCH